MWIRFAYSYDTVGGLKPTTPVTIRSMSVNAMGINLSADDYPTTPTRLRSPTYSGTTSPRRDHCSIQVSLPLHVEMAESEPVDGAFPVSETRLRRNTTGSFGSGNSGATPSTRAERSNGSDISNLVLELDG